MGSNRKLLVGTVALVLIIGLLAGTGVIMAHEEDEPSNGEESDEDGTWHCHPEEEDHHHEVDEHHHGGGHHHEEISPAKVLSA